MTAIDLSTWLTKPQAAEAIGVSTKQVERLQQAGKLEQRSRPQERGPHVAVYNPDDVARIAQERSPTPAPFVLPAGTAEAVPHGNGTRRPGPAVESTALTIGESSIVGIDELRALVALALRTVLSQTSETSAVSPTVYVTLREAAAISGLSQAYLHRRIEEKTLPAIRDRGWRIRRKDLEAL